MVDEKPAGGLTLGALQRQIRDLYGDKDGARGDAATFLWLAEEFGELATALRSPARTRSWPWRWPTSWPGSPRWPTSAASTWRRPSGRSTATRCPGCRDRPLRLRPRREAVKGHGA